MYKPLPIGGPRSDKRTDRINEQQLFLLSSPIPVDRNLARKDFRRSLYNTRDSKDFFSDAVNFSTTFALVGASENESGSKHCKTCSQQTAGNEKIVETGSEYQQWSPVRLMCEKFHANKSIAENKRP